MYISLYTKKSTGIFFKSWTIHINHFQCPPVIFICISFYFILFLFSMFFLLSFSFSGHLCLKIWYDFSADWIQCSKLQMVYAFSIWHDFGTLEFEFVDGKIWWKHDYCAYFFPEASSMCVYELKWASFVYILLHVKIMLCKQAIPIFPKRKRKSIPYSHLFICTFITKSLE